MCKKNYTDGMAKYIKSVSYRTSFFSKPSFKSSYIDSFLESFSDSPYKERKLTQYECQMIDIDTIAAELDIALVDLMDQKVYVFNDVSIAGRKADVFVCHYYIYVYIEIPGEVKKKEEIIKEDKLIEDLTPVLGLHVLENVQVQQRSCIVRHSVNIPADEFPKTKVLDLEAFPKMYPDELSVGRYSDSEEENDNTITLTRDVAKGENEIDNKFYLKFNITSTVSSINDNSKEMLVRALKESARCFSNKL